MLAGHQQGEVGQAVIPHPPMPAHGPLLLPMAEVTYNSVSSLPFPSEEEGVRDAKAAWEGEGLRSARCDNPPPASTAFGGSMARPVARAKSRQRAGFVVTETCDGPDFRVTETRDDPDKTRPGKERSNPSPLEGEGVGEADG